MKFSMNWGRWLIVVFIIFAGGMLFLVYKANNTKYDLVSKEYYQEELRYQDKIDGMNNAAKLSDISFLQDDKNFTVQFPKEIKNKKIEGELFFYCPTEVKKDIKIPIQSDTSNQQVISKKQLFKTAYHIKISWKVDTTNYFTEKEIIVK